MATLWRADRDIRSEVTGSQDDEPTGGVYGRDAKFRPSCSGELFDLPELRLLAQIELTEVITWG